MFISLWSLLLLACTGALIEAQEAHIHDEIFVPTGKSGYVFSNKYIPGDFYQWSIKSNDTIRMNCIISDLPWPNVVTFQRAENEPELTFGGSFHLIKTFPNQVTIKLKTKAGSSGGSFDCRFKSVSTNAKCSCGWKNPARITNGEETGIHEFPMMAGIFDVSNTLIPRSIICGATIINKKQIITTSSCLKNRNIQNIQVLVGDHNLALSTDTTETRSFKIHNVKDYPGYDINNNINDVAIITIDGTIEFNHQVGPACLPFQNQTDSFVNEQVTLLGWGSTGFTEGPSSFLQKANVKVISNESCKNLANGIRQSKLCTQHGSKDSCRGDGGGPILWHDTVSKRLFLVGIIGSGGICGEGRPLVNTRVSSFLDWIDEQKPDGIEYCENPEIM